MASRRGSKPKKEPSSPEKRASDDELRQLFLLVAARDVAKALQALAESPALARRVAEVGATREDPHTYFFANISHYSYAGDTALHLAAAAYATDIARQLVAVGADVHARNRRGAQPLHYATDGGPGSDSWDPTAQEAMVQLLIQSGADPNAKDATGVAPLHRAVRTRCTGAVRALLRSGADVRLANKSGSTPLHLAVQDTGRGGAGSPAARAEQQAIIQLLLAHGARPTDEDSSGISVRARAKAEWIQRLLSGGE